MEDLPHDLGVCLVAHLAEGVDRNVDALGDYVDGRDVALLAEGVDRNEHLRYKVVVLVMSPSSRRAWIEITSTC